MEFLNQCNNEFCVIRDVCDSNDDIIYTIRPKEEVDLHNFVKDLG